MTGIRRGVVRSHADYRLLAAAAVDGRIAPDDAKALEAHLATCDSCRADQVAMIADNAWLASPIRVAPPGPDVRAAVLDAARSRRVPRTDESRRPWAMVVAAAALIVLLVGPAVLSVLQPPGPGASGGPSESPHESLPSGGACTPHAEQMTAWWTGDGSANDRIASRDGRLLGDTGFGPGLVGEAFQFDGAGDAVEVTDLVGLNVGESDFMVALWVLEAVPYGGVLIEHFRGAPRAGWSLVVDEDGRLNAGLTTSDGPFHVETGPGEFPLGRWTHVALTRRGGEFSLLMNGNVVARENLPAGVRADLGISGPLSLGGHTIDRGDDFPGSLDEVQMLVGSTLTDGDIVGMYDAAVDGACSAGATPVAPLPSPTSGFIGSGVPFGTFEGRAIGIARTAGELDIAVEVRGIGVDTSGSVQIGLQGEEPWTGTIERLTFWYDSGSLDYVALIEGCKPGPACVAYELMLIDGRDREDGFDHVRFHYPVVGEAPPVHDTFVYLVVTGEVVVDGRMEKA